MSFPTSPFDWNRSSSRQSGGGEGSHKDDSCADFDPLDRSSSKANNVYTPQTSVRRHIRHMTGLVADPIELDLDQRRLQHALASAGEHSLGVDAISVWRVDEDNGKLIHPPGGWWRSTNMEVVGSGSSRVIRDVALARLEDRTRDDYVPPTPVSPGTDIAGILWAESRGDNNLAVSRRSSLRRAFDSGVSIKSLENNRHQSSQVETSAVLTTLNFQPIRWRDIKSISQDPDSAKGPRLKLMEAAGFRMAAGITFQYMHHRGMVIFLTTAEDENENRLTGGITHGAYLYQAAQFIGATLSLAEIRRASLAERYELKERCYSMMHYGRGNGYATRQLSSSMEEARVGKDCSAGDDDFSGRARHGNNGKTAKSSHQSSNRCHIPHQVLAWSHKLKGGSLQIPPSLSWTQSSWTVFGTLLNLLMLSALNKYYRLLSDDEYSLLIGPFGAMCTLMYGLSAAPASQPRNAVMGQAVAGAVSLAFTYIPEYVLPVWARTAVGPAFAIGVMVRLGVVHPPAGAHSVLYASGKYNFGFYALVVLSTAISVVPATVVNNMSSKRQYPTYWGVGGMSSFICRSFGFKGHDKKGANREGSSNNENLGVAKMANLPESDVRLVDTESMASSEKAQTNLLETREVGNERGNHGDTPPTTNNDPD